MAKGIRALLDTVLQALPQVGNLGLLFFLLFFIFAALGVELFGRLECSHYNPCTGLSRHAHFESFGMAFLTLFRIATGDNWNGIMKDTLRTKCNNSDSCQKNCCVSPVFAPVYFVVFVLMSQFVLVNVVVAVLMKHLEESHELMNDDDDIEVEIRSEIEEENKDKNKNKVVLNVDGNALDSKKECKTSKEKIIINRGFTKSNDRKKSLNISAKCELSAPRGSSDTLCKFNLSASKKFQEHLSQSHPLLLFNFYPLSMQKMKTFNTSDSLNQKKNECKIPVLKRVLRRWNTTDNRFQEPNESKKFPYQNDADININEYALTNSNNYLAKDKSESDFNNFTDISSMAIKKQKTPTSKPHFMLYNLPMPLVKTNIRRLKKSKPNPNSGKLYKTQISHKNKKILSNEIESDLQIDEYITSQSESKILNSVNEEQKLLRTSDEKTKSSDSSSTNNVQEKNIIYTSNSTDPIVNNKYSEKFSFIMAGSICRKNNTPKIKRKDDSSTNIVVQIAMKPNVEIIDLESSI